MPIKYFATRVKTEYFATFFSKFLTVRQAFYSSRNIVAITYHGFCEKRDDHCFDLSQEKSKKTEYTS